LFFFGNHPAHKKLISEYKSHFNNNETIKKYGLSSARYSEKNVLFGFSCKTRPALQACLL